MNFTIVQGGIVSTVEKFEQVGIVKCQKCQRQNLSWNPECTWCGMPLESLDDDFKQLSSLVQKHRRQQAIDEAVKRTFTICPYSVKSLVDRTAWSSLQYMTLGIIKMEFYKIMDAA